MYQPNNESNIPLEQNEEHKVSEAGPSRMEGTNSSDEEQELSLAEESVIEECLNDTEGSLSSVDLDLFAPSPPHERSNKKLSTDLLTQDFNDDSSLQSISSLEDSMIDSNELPDLTDLNINPSVEELSKHIAGIIKCKRDCDFANEVRPRRSSAKAFTSVPKTSSSLSNTTMPIQRRIVRRKRRNSPPTKKYDKDHIYSFFSAMADLVVTFPPSQIILAERNITRILSEMVSKVDNWRKDTSPNKPFRDADNDIDLLAIQLKLYEAPFHSFSHSL